ncbi:MAG: thiamine diphosphokinase [Odoribacter sp.]|nr:thiamine diphosphokinase [Odoribacter sp.]
MNGEYHIFPETAILANGKFPDHPIPLGFLLNAKRVICCDGAADSIIDFGLEPFAIVGDCDSVNKKIAEKFYDRIFRDNDQETNDLTKAVKWCSVRGYNHIVILGATGKREDHTVGNISLLAEYANIVAVKMVTDAGFLFPVLKNCKIESEKGQQVSVFSIDPGTEITSSGLKYRLERKKLPNWWTATLNEAEGKSFTLEFEGGPLLVFLKFPD